MEKIIEDLRLCRADGQAFREALDKLTYVILSTAPRLRDSDKRMLLIETRLEKMCKELECKEIELQNRSLALEERANVVEVKEAMIADLEIKIDLCNKDIEEQAGQMSKIRESMRKIRGSLENVFWTETNMKESEEEIEKKRKRASSWSAEETHHCDTSRSSSELISKEEEF